MPAAWIARSVNTLMVTGTSRNASSRLRAVTTTSSSVVTDCCWASTSTDSIDASASSALNDATRPLFVRIWNPSRLMTRTFLLARALHFGAHQASPCNHRFKLSKCHIPGQVFHAAIRCDDDVFGSYKLERATNARRNRFRRLDIQVGKIDNAENDLLALE